MNLGVRVRYFTRMLAWITFLLLMSSSKTQTTNNYLTLVTSLWEIVVVDLDNLVVEKTIPINFVYQPRTELFPKLVKTVLFDMDNEVAYVCNYSPAFGSNERDFLLAKVDLKSGIAIRVVLDREDEEKRLIMWEGSLGYDRQNGYIYANYNSLGEHSFGLFRIAGDLKVAEFPVLDSAPYDGSPQYNGFEYKLSDTGLDLIELNISQLTERVVLKNVQNYEAEGWTSAFFLTNQTTTTTSLYFSNGRAKTFLHEVKKSEEKPWKITNSLECSFNVDGNVTTMFDGDKKFDSGQLMVRQSTQYNGKDVFYVFNIDQEDFNLAFKVDLISAAEMWGYSATYHIDPEPFLIQGVSDRILALYRSKQGTKIAVYNIEGQLVGNLTLDKDVAGFCFSKLAQRKE